LIDPDKRERQVVSLLEFLPDDVPGVLVGGYAVAAYGIPRYSVDVDIVAPFSSRDAWTNWLTLHRLQRQRTHLVSRNGETHIEVQRWEHDAITLDLMIGGVRDRESGGVIPDSWLLRDPATVRLELLSGPLARPIKVVRLEGLWATKLLAGRPHDLTDLFSIRNQKVNLAEVREFFSESQGSSLRRKLRSVIAQVTGPKLYADALSRLRLGSPDLQSNLDSWRRFAQMVESALPP
jgi:Nucleotidyl transferase AbiEii toxin, Type IV TA system